MSSFGRPAAAVRMMTPPAKPCLLAELADDAAQAAALVARFDLAGHADVVDRRHEDEEAAGHRGVRGEARALRPERLLGHLDDDLLPFLQELFDLRLGALVAVAVAAAPPRPPLRAGRLGAASPAPGAAAVAPRRWRGRRRRRSRRRRSRGGRTPRRSRRRRRRRESRRARDRGQRTPTACRAALWIPGPCRDCQRRRAVARAR